GEARRAAGAGSRAGWPINSLSRVVLRDELVHEDGAVVMDDFTLEAAVGVLVDDAAAATGVVQVVGQPATIVLFLIVLSVHDLPTRGPAPRGLGGHGNHRLSSFGPSGPGGGSRGGRFGPTGEFTPSARPPARTFRARSHPAPAAAFLLDSRAKWATI